METSSPLSSPPENIDSSGLNETNSRDEASSPFLEPIEDDEAYSNSSSKTPSRTKKAISKSKSSKSKRGAKKSEKKITSRDMSESEEEVIYTHSSSSRRNKAKIEEDQLSDEEFFETTPVTDPTKLTRRQKAKYLDEYTEELLELKPDSRKKELTVEEAALKRSELARKRKHQSQQKAERDKQETINKLLKKQANKKQKVIVKDNEEILNPKTLSYRLHSDGRATLSFPKDNIGLLVNFKKEDSIISPQRCDVKNCQGVKKYCDPKTKLISCSFEHYKLLKQS